MLSVCIITKNEEKHIGLCLQKLQWADEIILVDSGSNDNTVEIAKSYGAKIFTRPFDNFSKQKNYCIKQATKQWILLVDADEFIEKKLAQEIQEVITNQNTYRAFWVTRQVRWLGKPLRFGGLQNEALIRLIKNGYGYYQRDVHEEMIVDGKVGHLTHSMLHDTTPTMNDYIRKHRHYLILDLRMRLKTGKIPSLAKIWLWPSLLFVRKYIFQLGFLDGLNGFKYQLACVHFVWAKYKLTRKINLKRKNKN